MHTASLSNAPLCPNLRLQGVYLNSWLPRFQKFEVCWMWWSRRVWETTWQPYLCIHEFFVSELPDFLNKKREVLERSWWSLRQHERGWEPAIWSLDTTKFLWRRLNGDMQLISWSGWWTNEHQLRHIKEDTEKKQDQDWRILTRWSQDVLRVQVRENFALPFSLNPVGMGRRGKKHCQFFAAWDCVGEGNVNTFIHSSKLHNRIWERFRRHQKTRMVCAHCWLL